MFKGDECVGVCGFGWGGGGGQGHLNFLFAIPFTLFKRDVLLQRVCVCGGGGGGGGEQGSSCPLVAPASVLFLLESIMQLHNTASHLLFSHPPHLPPTPIFTRPCPIP